MYMRNVLLTLGFLTLGALMSLAAISDNAFADHAYYEGYGVVVKANSALN